VDYFWEKLSEGGTKSRCGWLKDQFGLSWQVVPNALNRLLKESPEKANRVMKALMKMDKLDIKTLEAA
jgi:predicted 3-demethylubiquinone-9 3-methyltransferase (glyoxalase superfamily)